MNWLRQKYKEIVLFVQLWKLRNGLKNGGNIMELVFGVLRAILAAAGGYAVNKGIADQETVDAIIGALIVVATSAWSVWAKIKSKKG